MQTPLAGMCVYSVVRRSSTGDAMGGADAPPSVVETLRRGSAGRQLAARDAKRFSASFGTDLSDVRLHTDAEADAAVRSVDADAFTYGSDVYFSKSSFAPGQADGERILAHELAHVVQNRTGIFRRTAGANVSIGRAGDPSEAAADRAADAVLAGRAPDGSVKSPVSGGRGGRATISQVLRRGRKKKRLGTTEPPASQVISGNGYVQDGYIQDSESSGDSSEGDGRGNPVPYPLLGDSFAHPGLPPANGFGLAHVGQPLVGEGTYIGGGSSVDGGFASGDGWVPPMPFHGFGGPAHGFGVPAPMLVGGDGYISGGSPAGGPAPVPAPLWLSPHTGGFAPIVRPPLGSHGQPPAGSSGQPTRGTAVPKKTRAALAQLGPVPARQPGEHRAFLTRGIGYDYVDERTSMSSHVQKGLDHFKLALTEIPNLPGRLQAGDTPKAAAATITSEMEIAKALRADLEKLADDKKDDALVLVDTAIVQCRELARRQDIPFKVDGSMDDVADRRVTYDSQQERAKSRVTIRDGKLYRDSGEAVDTGKSSTFFSGNGVEMFVASATGDIHMASHKIGKYHHSSLLAADQVSIGGEMCVANGTIKWVTNKSGHYTPTKDHLVQFLHWLGKDKVALDQIEIRAGFSGVPPNVTAAQLVAGLTAAGDVDDRQGFQTVKLKAVLTALNGHISPQLSVDAWFKSRKWTYADGRVTDDDTGLQVDPKIVIKALKAVAGRQWPVQDLNP